MAAYNIDDSNSGSGASFSNTQNVVANNDTITWTVGGFVGGTSLSKSDSNCTATLSWSTVPSSGGNSGKAQITINNFTRSTSNGSYSATITGTGKDNNNNQITRTATISGTIGASTGTISITGMDGNNAFEAGDTATISWTSNDSSAKGFNSSGSNRFSPATGSNTLSGTSGSFTATCLTSTAADGVWENNNFTLKISTSTSAQIAASNSVVLFASANAGTAGLTLTTDTQSNGTFIITGSTTATSPGTINYRFIDGPNTSGTILQAFSTSNTYSGTGSQRGSPITLQVREQIQTNNTGTVYSQDFSSATITVPYVNPQTNVTLPTNKNILWDASSFSLTIGNGNILDEYKVVLTSNTSVVLKDWTTKNTASGSDFTFTVSNNINTTYFPNQSLSDPGVSCTVFVRRSTTNGGNGSATSVGTFTVKRRYREGPFTFISDPASATIGAQEYFAYGGTTRAVTIGGAGIVNGFTYIAKIASGTTYGGATSGIVITSVASGGSAAGILTRNQMPPANSSVTYRVFCIVPTSLGGDGTTEWACTPLQIYSPANSAQTGFTVTREDYVSPDTSVSSSTSATAVDVNLRTYQIGSSSTSETISYTGGNAVTQYRILEPVGSVEVDTNTGASGTLTINNANLPTAGNNKLYWLQARVQTVNDGTGTWVNTDDTQYSGLEYVYQLTRETLATPTAGTLSAYRNNANGAKIVPSLALTWNGGTGEVEYAFSTTNTTPTNWTGTGYVDNGNSGLSRVTGPATARSATALYMGVRQKSVIDGTTTTPSYSSNTGGPFYNELFGSTDIEITYDGTVYFPGDGETPILVPATDNTNPATVSGFSKQAYSETSIDANSVGDGSKQTVTNYSSFEITTDAANTNVGPAGTLVAFDTVNSSGNPSLVISNPSEMPASGDATLQYTLYEYIFTARGGRGTKVATTPATENQISIRKQAPIDGDITVTVPKTNLTPADGSQIITIADGNGTTEYRIRVTGSTDANSDGSPPTTATTVGTRTGNGTLTISSANLPDEGDTVSYKVQHREAGTSGSFIDCTGTNSTFTIGRIQDFTITDGAPNTNRQVNTAYDSNSITVNGISGTETVTVRQNSGNTQVAWAQSSVNGGAFSNSNKSITNGQSLVIRFTTSSADNTSRTIRVTFTGSGHEELWTLTSGASTGTGGGGGGQTGTGDYGLQINNSSGNTLIDQNSRVTRSVANGGPVDINGSGTTSSAISVTGLTNTDDWTIVVVATRAPTSGFQTAKFSVNKGTGSFTITNDTQDDNSGDPNNDRRRFYWRVFKSA